MVHALVEVQNLLRMGKVGSKKRRLWRCSVEQTVCRCVDGVAPSSLLAMLELFLCGLYFSTARYPIRPSVSLAFFRDFTPDLATVELSTSADWPSEVEGLSAGRWTLLRNATSALVVVQSCSF